MLEVVHSGQLPSSPRMEQTRPLPGVGSWLEVLSVSSSNTRAILYLAYYVNGEVWVWVVELRNFYISPIRP